MWFTSLYRLEMDETYKGEIYDQEWSILERRENAMYMIGYIIGDQFMLKQIIHSVESLFMVLRQYMSEGYNPIAISTVKSRNDFFNKNSITLFETAKDIHRLSLIFSVPRVESISGSQRDVLKQIDEKHINVVDVFKSSVYYKKRGTIGDDWIFRHRLLGSYRDFSTVLTRYWAFSFFFWWF